MIRTYFFKLVFCMLLIMGISCSFASADDVEIVSYTDSLYLDSTLSVGQGSYNLVSDTMAPLDSVTANWFGGSAFHSGYRISYLYPVSDTISGYAEYMNQYYSYSIANGSDRPLPASLTLNTGSIVLDTTGFSSGAYHYSCEFYVGIGYHRVQHQINTSFYVPATFALDNVSLSNNFFTYSYVGKEQVTYYTNGGNASVDLLHFHFDCYFELDGTETSKTFSLDTICDFILGSPISYDFATQGPFGSRNSRTFYYLTNNRFVSELWKVDSMPIPPSPTPTPYPGQDTQESINQGVQTIITALDISATPIPTPADLKIDETIFDELETMTLPDVSSTSQNFLDLWSIFAPLWPFLGILFGSLTVVGIFLYFLRGGFI